MNEIKRYSQTGVENYATNAFVIGFPDTHRSPLLLPMFSIEDATTSSSAKMLWGARWSTTGAWSPPS